MWTRRMPAMWMITQVLVTELMELTQVLAFTELMELTQVLAFTVLAPEPRAQR